MAAIFKKIFLGVGRKRGGMNEASNMFVNVLTFSAGFTLKD